MRCLRVSLRKYTFMYALFCVHLYFSLSVSVHVFESICVCACSHLVSVGSDWWPGVPEPNTAGKSLPSLHSAHHVTASLPYAQLFALVTLQRAGVCGAEVRPLLRLAG